MLTCPSTPVSVSAPTAVTVDGAPSRSCANDTG
ncbi:Uncharacterised protein [Mycobacteroides abscessus]|nr:Uncharacterised protein [Mycobacteroides abscessus]